MSSIDSMPTMPTIAVGPEIAMSSASKASALTVDPEVLSLVRAVAAAAKDLKEVRGKLEDLGKQINDKVAQIHRAVGSLWAGIERGPSPGEEFGALEGNLIDADDLEEKLVELKSARSVLTAHKYKLIRQLRAARLEMRKVPFEELMRVVKSEKSTEEEYEAAKAEMRRREMLCLAIRHILGGKYTMPHKDRKYCVYDWFDSTAEDVRNETVVDIARFAFSEEDAKTIGKVVCELLGWPESDGSDVALTELCALSEAYGPRFVSREDYQ